VWIVDVRFQLQAAYLQPSPPFRFGKPLLGNPT
jgi:hypothetical protein